MWDLVTAGAAARLLVAAAMRASMATTGATTPMAPTVGAVVLASMALSCVPCSAGGDSQGARR